MGNELSEGEGRFNISAVDFLPDRKQKWPLSSAPWSDGYSFVSPVDHYGERAAMDSEWQICVVACGKLCWITSTPKAAIRNST